MPLLIYVREKLREERDKKKTEQIRKRNREKEIERMGERANEKKKDRMKERKQEIYRQREISNEIDNYVMFSKGVCVMQVAFRVAFPTQPLTTSIARSTQPIT